MAGSPVHGPVKDLQRKTILLRVNRRIRTVRGAELAPMARSFRARRRLVVAWVAPPISWLSGGAPLRCPVPASLAVDRSDCAIQVIGRDGVPAEEQGERRFPGGEGEGVGRGEEAPSRCSATVARARGERRVRSS